MIPVCHYTYVCGPQGPPVLRNSHVFQQLDDWHGRGIIGTLVALMTFFLRSLVPPWPIAGSLLEVSLQPLWEARRCCSKL